MKRKRKQLSLNKSDSPKRRKVEQNASAEPGSHVAHPVLHLYFPRVSSLRQYLLSRLASASKKRRNLIEKVGTSGPLAASQSAQIQCSAEATFLLDQVLVGSSHQIWGCADGEAGELVRFSQARSGSTAPGSSEVTVSQSDVVDFCISYLFRKRHPHARRPAHILCHGMQRLLSTFENEAGIHVGCGIPGLSCIHPNDHVETIKSRAWCEILELLGQTGARVMMDLIVDCSIFVPVDGSKGSYYQLSGRPLFDAKPLGAQPRGQPLVNDTKKTTETPTDVHKPSELRFVRHRMFYARAALNAKGEVSFGLRHIHVLNRFPDSSDRRQTVHVMKYIFPRQFGLHNVFTCKTDPKQTVQPFQDYTLREQEIARREREKKKHLPCSSLPKFQSSQLPKRLRGMPFNLVRRLQMLHKRCSYSQLLAHYCPVPDAGHVAKDTESPSSQRDFTQLETLPCQVSAFCRAVVRRVIPKFLIGDGSSNDCNWTLLMKNVDAMISARRFESLTLEAAVEGMKIQHLAWLRPRRIKAHDRMALSDFNKRRQLFLELIYYIFDSFIIPLVRSNFHVTESNAHKNRLFYFRHDVWRKMAEPAMSMLKLSMFEDVGNERALQKLGNRALGYSQIRLLPKAAGMRPIMNLRRRCQVKVRGHTLLDKSINSTLKPISTVLNYEKSSHPDILGSSLFSIDEAFRRIGDFRNRLNLFGLQDQTLYFAKVDIKACFDRLSQTRAVEVAERLLSAEQYSIAHHAEVKSSDLAATSNRRVESKPLTKFVATAGPICGTTMFTQVVRRIAESKRKYTCFVDAVVPHTLTRKAATQLLREHVQCNIVRIGKKFYRQKRGIPQGSVLSSLLCSILLADFEASHLNFLAKGSPSLLLRLIDDFLLITTDRGKAMEFLTVMRKGSPEYGVTISPAKSLVNFEACIDGEAFPRLPSTTDEFPYCGMQLNTATLDISKDSIVLRKGAKVADALTIDHAKIPVQSFRRKMLTSLKMQMQTMLLDTSHNSVETVAKNIYHSLHETAVKCYEYIKHVRSPKKPSGDLMVSLVGELAALAFVMARSRRHKTKSAGYKCTISRGAMGFLATLAFARVFETKQTRFPRLVTWLKGQKKHSSFGSKREAAMISQVLRRHIEFQ